MTLSLLLLLGQASTPALVLEKDGFLVRGLGKEVREPLVRPDIEPKRITYRKDDSFAVWDARGLSIRHGKFTYTTRLPEVTLTPKLFSTEQIVATRDAIAAGDRSREAAALSGSKRIADDVYFLVRWEDKAGQAWLEALVKVNLSLAKPKPELVGRFDGLTTAEGAVDDQLFLSSGILAPGEVAEGTPPGLALAAYVRQGNGPWGVAWFDRLEKQFGSQQFGEDLLNVALISARSALVAERTAYGKVRIARVDVITGARRELAEVLGTPKFVDALTPSLVQVQTNLGPALRNLETGVQMNLPEKAVVRRTIAGILVWPEGKPELAAVYSPERFLRLAAVKSLPVEAGQSKPTVRKPPPR